MKLMLVVGAAAATDAFARLCRSLSLLLLLLLAAALVHIALRSYNEQQQLV
jgi:hypothetical protein